MLETARSLEEIRVFFVVVVAVVVVRLPLRAKIMSLSSLSFVYLVLLLVTALIVIVIVIVLTALRPCNFVSLESLSLAFSVCRIFLREVPPQLLSARFSTLLSFCYNFYSLFLTFSECLFFFSLHVISCLSFKFGKVMIR